MHDEQVYSENAYLIAADFKMIMHKAAAHARSDALRATTSTLGAMLLLVATPLRSYRIRYFGTLIRYCEAWQLAVQCMNARISPHWLTPWPASRVAAVQFWRMQCTTFHGHRRDKDEAFAKCRRSRHAWSAST